VPVCHGEKVQISVEKKKERRPNREFFLISRARIQVMLHDEGRKGNGTNEEQLLNKSLGVYVLTWITYWSCPYFSTMAQAFSTKFVVVDMLDN
jgi:hypothetical protein